MAPETLRVLSWNLYHGRAVPPAGRSLLEEFAAMLAGWRWDVALLQEVPPWWGPKLAARCQAQQRTVLTSRNALLALRRVLAERYPDVVKSSGGGSNAILVRGAILEHRRLRLRWWPERRMLHGVRLTGGAWVANLHATVHHPARAAAEIERARGVALEWAGSSPLVLGGDFNRREPEVPDFVHAARSGVDHVFARGFDPLGPAVAPARGELSDHAPLAVDLGPAGSGSAAAASGGV